MDKDIMRLLFIIFIVLIFLLIFGIRYLRSKEIMAMVERGMMPPDARKVPGNRLILYSCLFFGFGLGLLASHFAETYFLADSPGLAKLVFISLFLGAALLVAYKLQEEKGQ